MLLITSKYLFEFKTNEFARITDFSIRMSKTISINIDISNHNLHNEAVSRFSIFKSCVFTYKIHS